MKKIISVMLAAVLIITSVLSIYITEITAESVNEKINLTDPNLAKDYTVANGDIEVDANSSPWQTAGVYDYTDPNETIYGSSGGSVYSWRFGTTNNVGKNIINANGLKPYTKYYFSYVYARDFNLVLDGVKDSEGDYVFEGFTADSGTVVYPEGVTVASLSNDGRIKKVEFYFTTNASTDYDIVLKTCKSWANVNWNWSHVRLSDLVLSECGDNLAAYYTSANGAVSWTSNAEPHFKDDKSKSLFGGYAWGFGVSSTDATKNKLAYVYIKAADLEPDTNYTFSYYYSEDFIVKYESVKNPSGQVVTDVTTPIADYVEGFSTARKVSFDFKTNAEGEYLITLKTAKYLNNIPCNWSKTVLSDLCLVKQERELSYGNIAEFYSGNQSGHGSGNFTFTNVGTVKAENSLKVEGFKSVAWRFGLDNTNSEGDPKDALASENKAYFYLKLENLEANTSYDFSFVYGMDYIVKLLESGKITNIADSNAVEYSAPVTTQYTTGDRTYQVKTTFKTTTAGDYMVVLESCKGAGYRNDSCSWDSVTIGDFSLKRTIIDGVRAEVKGSFGGTATSNFKDGLYPKKSTITVTATPKEGNTFVGWYDDNDALVSSENPYSFKTDKYFNLTAKFTGNNMNTYDYLSDLDFDGTFENGTVSGWAAEDRWAGSDQYVPSVWCTFKRTNTVSYDGNYSLKFDANHQASYLKLQNLVPESDYRISFYINMPGYAQNSKLVSFGITNEDGTIWSTEGNWIAAGSGWHRVDAYFNSGNLTEAQLNFHYQGYSSVVDGKNVADKYFYLDNLEICQYKANKTILNWQGTAVLDDDFLVLENEGDFARQTLALEENSKYTVSFSAMGEVLAAMYDIQSFLPSDENLITSQSSMATSAGDWKEYSFEFFTSEHKAVNIAFVALDENAKVKEISITKNDSGMGAIVEKVDFETSRFALKNSDKNVFSIYKKSSDSDNNVFSGDYSLLFNGSAAAENTLCIFDEAYLSNQVIKGGSYKLTLYYKSADGKNGGSILVTPEFRKSLDTNIGFEHTANNDGWNKLEFSFTNKNYTMLKTIIGTVLNKTKGSFYIDDITLTVVRSFVTERNVKEKYTATVYNFIENNNFEQAITNNNFKNLPKTLSVINGDAERNEGFLRVTAGTDYVLSVKVRANTEYIFSAAVRGENAEGYIGISATSDGKELFTDYNYSPASFIEPTSKSWERTAFRFSSGESSEVYLVIKCTEGSFDVDNLMLYMAEYGFLEDPNDYSVFEPYDYNAVSGENVILNGGVNGYKENNPSEDFPSTSDKGINRLVLPLIILCMSLVVATFVLGKKKERRSF
ncbi:MAG: hypothetical protein E7551_04070 [Ruminococcaceae bacterium]|nr:hypothetical protein [Oscillospiraceae bacterium]